MFWWLYRVNIVSEHFAHFMFAHMVLFCIISPLTHTVLVTTIISGNTKYVRNHLNIFSKKIYPLCHHQVLKLHKDQFEIFFLSSLKFFSCLKFFSFNWTAVCFATQTNTDNGWKYKSKRENWDLNLQFKQLSVQTPNLESVCELKICFQWVSV